MLRPTHQSHSSLPARRRSTLSCHIVRDAASAADDEGVISSIDREAGTITLDNGNSYKLPVEFDMDALQEGMQILLAYDDVAGEKMVTDMEIE